MLTLLPSPILHPMPTSPWVDGVAASPAISLRASYACTSLSQCQTVVFLPPGLQPVYIYQHSGPHTLFPELLVGLGALHLSVGCLALLPVLPEAPSSWLHSPLMLIQAQNGQWPGVVL